MPTKQERSLSRTNNFLHPIDTKVILCKEGDHLRRMEIVVWEQLLWPWVVDFWQAMPLATTTTGEAARALAKWPHPSPQVLSGPRCSAF
jgi:hypothetical protein